MALLKNKKSKPTCPNCKSHDASRRYANGSGEEFVCQKCGTKFRQFYSDRARTEILKH